MDSWFWGNAKIFLFSWIGGWVIASILVRLVASLLHGIANVAVLLAVVAFVAAIILGYVILIYAYLHRSEVKMSNKPVRTGFTGFLDRCTQSLWESKWFAYGMYGFGIIGIVIMISLFAFG